MSYLGIRQLRNILSYYYSAFCFRKPDGGATSQLLQMEFLLALKTQLENKLDEWQAGINLITVARETGFKATKFCLCFFIN
jgi:hypothetical protein